MIMIKLAQKSSFKNLKAEPSSFLTKNMAAAMFNCFYR